MDYEYMITAAISQILWRSNNRHPVVMYPSISRELNGTNVAFEPAFFCESYQVDHIHEIEIVAIEMERVKYRTLKRKQMVDEQGKIFWLDAPDDVQMVTHTNGV